MPTPFFSALQKRRTRCRLSVFPCRGPHFSLFSWLGCQTSETPSRPSPFFFNPTPLNPPRNLPPLFPRRSLWVHLRLTVQSENSFSLEDFEIHPALLPISIRLSTSHPPLPFFIVDLFFSTSSSFCFDSSTNFESPSLPLLSRPHSSLTGHPWLVTKDSHLLISTIRDRLRPFPTSFPSKIDMIGSLLSNLTVWYSMFFSSHRRSASLCFPGKLVSPAPRGDSVTFTEPVSSLLQQIEARPSPRTASAPLFSLILRPRR